MREFNKAELLSAVADAWNLTEVAIALGYSNPPGSTTKRRVKDALDRHIIDYSHLHKTSRPRFKYPRITKECPVCSLKFETGFGHPRERTTCSHSCSNTYFRSGSNHPNYRNIGANYRKVALRSLAHSCNRCEWDKATKILEVHHVDYDRSNNELSNLEILCPICHRLEHLS